MSRYIKITLITAFLALPIFFVLAQVNPGVLSLWAWSENIGWIHFNGSNYRVEIHPITGNLSNYAWSENIGWIHFDAVGPYPSDPQESAKYNFDTKQITGWAKAVAAADGWDGWIKMSGPVVPASNQLPSASITSPSGGATFNAGDNIIIDATASDSDGTVSKVEFYQGNTYLGQDLTSPYSYTWNSAPAGNYSLTARATDDGGAVAVSEPVNIAVSGISDLLNNLVSHWKLDEASGTRLDTHGTNDLTDNNTVTQAVGKIGEAAQCIRANSEYLSHTDNADLSLGSDTDYTWAAWFYLDSMNGLYSVLEKATGGAWGYQYYIYVSGTAIEAGLENGVTGTSISASSFGAPPIGTWIFVVAWHDGAGDTLNIQVNGGAVDKKTWTGGTFDGVGSLKIGGSVSSGRFFDGRIDSVSFWKRVLTVQERIDLYNAGAGKTYEEFNAVLVLNALSTVSITSPLGGATFNAGDNITINATASDSDGTVSKVEFYQGNTYLGQDLTSPYSYAWNSVVAGSYSLTAVAIDNGGAVSVSSPVDIEVLGAPIGSYGVTANTTPGVCKLEGYAWGSDVIGWIHFSNAGPPAYSVDIDPDFCALAYAYPKPVVNAGPDHSSVPVGQTHLHDQAWAKIVGPYSLGNYNWSFASCTDSGGSPISCPSFEDIINYPSTGNLSGLWYADSLTIPSIPGVKYTPQNCKSTYNLDLNVESSRGAAYVGTDTAVDISWETSFTLSANPTKIFGFNFGPHVTDTSKSTITIPFSSCVNDNVVLSVQNVTKDGLPVTGWAFHFDDLSTPGIIETGSTCTLVYPYSTGCDFWTSIPADLSITGKYIITVQGEQQKVGGGGYIATTPIELNIVSFNVEFREVLAPFENFLASLGWIR